jgi:hypothetical protein
MKQNRLLIGIALIVAGVASCTYIPKRDVWEYIDEREDYLLGRIEFSETRVKGELLYEIKELQEKVSKLELRLESMQRAFENENVNTPEIHQDNTTMKRRSENNHEHNTHDESRARLAD